MRLRITLLLLMACPALAHAADDVAPPPRPIPPSGGVPSVLIPDDATCDPSGANCTGFVAVKLGAVQRDEKTAVAVLIPDDDAIRAAKSQGMAVDPANPPFAPLAQTPHPVIVGDHANKPADWYCANWFPCGAVLDGDSWLVSAGCHDREIEIARWDAAQLSEVCRVRSLAESAT